MKCLDKQYVQDQLSLIGYQKEFLVIFLKANGEQRKVRAMLEKPSKPVDYSKPVAVIDLDKGGWSSFKTDNVLMISEVI